MAEEADDELSEGWFRRFWLVRLTPEQLRTELARHQDFRRYVGTHFDYDKDRRRDFSGRREQTKWHKFYDKYDECERDPGDLSQNEVVGWFEM